MLNPFAKRGDPHALLVGMTGVKLADRIAQIGCAHGGRMAAVAAKVGLSGHAVVVVPDQASAERAQKGAADAGVLVEIEIAPPGSLPLDADAFDLALVDDTGGLFATMRVETRVMACRELLRILRQGGRVMVVSAAPRGGLGAVVTRVQSGPPFDAVPFLEAEGFRAVRRLAEKEGMIFVEGIKPRALSPEPITEGT